MRQTFTLHKSNIFEKGYVAVYYCLLSLCVQVDDF